MELIVEIFLIALILKLFKYFNISEIEMYLINQWCLIIKLVELTV